MLLNEFLKAHSKIEEQKATITQLKKELQATAAHQQKQIEALTAGLQKVSAQLEASKPGPANGQQSLEPVLVVCLLIPTDERSGLQTRIRATKSDALKRARAQCASAGSPLTKGYLPRRQAPRSML